VLVTVQAGKSAEVDHGATLSGIEAHGVSLRLSLT
jgi:hypothetical protein